MRVLVSEMAQSVDDVSLHSHDVEEANTLQLQQSLPYRGVGYVLAIIFAGGALIAICASLKAVAHPPRVDVQPESFMVAEELVPGMCGSEDLVDEKGQGYRGCQNVAMDGQACQFWSSQKLHWHRYLRENSTGSGIGNHNYCRNPSGSSNIWCFIDSESENWQWCKPLQEGKTSVPTAVQHSRRLGVDHEEEPVEEEPVHDEEESTTPAPNKCPGFFPSGEPSAPPKSGKCVCGFPELHCKAHLPEGQKEPSSCSTSEDCKQSECPSGLPTCAKYPVCPDECKGEPCFWVDEKNCGP